MTALSLAGPSYALRFGKADCERTINWIPVSMENGTGKGGATAYLKQAPGLVQLGAVSGECRGMVEARGVLYAVFGTKLYSISSAWAFTLVATLSTLIETGPVQMAVNNTQIGIVDRDNLNVWDLDLLTLTTNPANWLGSSVIDLLDGYGVLIDPDTEQFYITANQDFTTINALDYASAEGSTGNLVSVIVKHREAIFLKANTGEVWYDSGDASFALSRNTGANIEVGCSATHTLAKKGGVAFWLGRDESGSPAVFQMAAYSPQRISTHPLEEKLSLITDFSGATAFCYSQDGLSFYVLQVPGIETTWVYEMSTGLWHERAELVDGQYQPWRATTHCYVYGAHVVGDVSGAIYKLDPLANDNAGDALVRDRITPHQALPSLSRQRVGSMQIDCDVGAGLSGSDAKLMLRYSDDGGANWGNWRHLTLGEIGKYKARARATMLGAARDRVWHIRVTDAVACNLLSAVIDEI